MARILQICNSDFYLVGFLSPLVRALRSAGHTVECVCESSDLRIVTDELQVVVYSVPFPKTGSVASFRRCVWELRKLIREGHYECVNSHNRNASIAGRIAAWWEKVPINLYTAHGFYFHDDQARYQREATIWLERLLARMTTFTLSQSAEDLRFMVDQGFIAPERIAHIGNGIDTNRFRYDPDRQGCERRLGLASGPFRIGTIGRLVKGKGFLDLLRAFARMHSVDADTELLLIGGNIEQDVSPFHDEFITEAQQLGVGSALRVTGLVRDVEAYLSACDAFVLPSYREGMPRALLEAMSASLPVIATDIRGCHEIVVHGKNGLLYPPHDVDRLTTLLGMLREQPDLCRTLRMEARNTVVNSYSELQYVTRQVTEIDRLLRWESYHPPVSTIH